MRLEQFIAEIQKICGKHMEKGAEIRLSLKVMAFKGDGEFVIVVPDQRYGREIERQELDFSIRV